MVREMTIAVNQVDPPELVGVTAQMREWQLDGSPMQLHPGDIGWHWRFGTARTAAMLRTWSSDGRLVAVGMLDSGELRLAIAPKFQQDEQLAREMARDITDPGRGVLPEGSASVEAPDGALLRQVLVGAGWEAAAPWTQLRRELVTPVDDPGVHYELVGDELAEVRAALQVAAFANSTFTAERWRTMAAAPTYRAGRCLVAFDDAHTPVAAVTVWSAGPGRPGLLEPMGVHHDHRGHGYGRAITLAAAATLRQLGASSATVCTSSSNVAAVATYKSAGLAQVREVPDLHRA